ncbi:MAG: hypothetical protein KIG51_00375, partial [Fibrobacter sp.]|nr:hypothetical protein [Fibrobacter sp.]
STAEACEHKPRPKAKPKPSFTANGVKDFKICIINPFISCKTISSEFHLLGKTGLQSFFRRKVLQKKMQAL